MHRNLARLGILGTLGAGVLACGGLGPPSNAWLKEHGTLAWTCDAVDGAEMHMPGGAVDGWAQGEVNDRGWKCFVRLHYPDSDPATYGGECPAEVVEAFEALLEYDGVSLEPKPAKNDAMRSYMVIYGGQKVGTAHIGEKGWVTDRKADPFLYDCEAHITMSKPN